MSHVYYNDYILAHACIVRASSYWIERYMVFDNDVTSRLKYILTHSIMIHVKHSDDSFTD